MPKNSRYILILSGLAYFFLMFGNGIMSLTIPDEVFYTQTAKEMVAQRSTLVPYLFGHPQFEKPIFLYWMLYIAFKFFGISSFSARFFPAVFGILGVIATYLLGALGFKNQKKAFLSALALLSCGLYMGLSRTVFTDMIFTVWILFSLLAFWWGYVSSRNKSKGLVLFFIFAGMAVLTKGPLGFIIPFLAICAFLIFKKEIKYLAHPGLFWGVLCFILVAAPWYIFVIKKYGQVFIQEFFYNDHWRRLIEAEHGSNDTWYFYPAYMIGCMFPWSIFLVAGVFSLFKNIRRLKDFEFFLICWIFATFIVFQPAHSKLVSYIFPLFPALALVTGGYIYQLVTDQNKQRQFKIMAGINWAILALFPIGILVASFIFPQYLSSKLVVYLLVAVFVAWLGLLLYFLLRRKFFGFVYATSFLVFIFLSAIPFIKDNVEPYISSRVACNYLLANYDVSKTTLLASKFCARGVKYYTDKEVAVFAVYQKDFFSPHPVIFPKTDAGVRDFLLSQPETFCLVKKSGVLDLERICRDNNFELTHLKQIGNIYILRVTPNPKLTQGD